MLVKNVYILYPPGYSGSYVNWAINISDNDLNVDAVKDPINQHASAKFGGKGTAHHHVRIPTHQGYPEHVNWMLYNRPTSPKIYILNVITDAEHVISEILTHDPTGVFIRIHDNNNSLINSYGYINCVTKWPTYFAATAARRQTPLAFDPFNCASDLAARNFFVDRLEYHWALPVDFTVLEKHIKSQRDWFYERNKYQPHEVNQSTYVTDWSIENRIFELSCRDIASPEFLTMFENFMTQSQASNSFDLSYVKEFHTNYINAQSNLQWFTSVSEWQQTGNLDQYLTGHSVTQACIIREIFKNVNLKQIVTSNNLWAEFYSKIKDPSWPDCTNEWEFYSLPKSIQLELTEMFEYCPKSVTDLHLMELHSIWRSKSIEEINSIYQQIKQYLVQ